MHILIFGATGRTGIHAYKYALEQGNPIPDPHPPSIKTKHSQPPGHHVTILVRNASSIPPQENLTIVYGSVTSEADVSKAFTAAGQPIDAVVTCLNARRTSEFPWAKFLGPPRLLADSTALVARQLRAQKHKSRLVIMSGQGVGESWAVTPWIVRFLIRHSNVGRTYDDMILVDKEIEGNCGENVAWVSTVAVGLSGGGKKPVKTFDVRKGGAGWFISRESCAMWMADVAMGKMGEEFDGKRVMVSN
ncbi:hypothetical protein P280DRAFT_466728 [Massarina eburnea CBS 473.64]|uniref:NAD(P)-binding domain-containing protein n=1 Tax=Massarina eburnea CBS 473.64 TaxID=1395130 RepID=A0A6A6S834_9PLEO|nr:hypothetical protein P280DRAFT_466728 [Massarina eburnea CBS 473.64]